MKKILFLLDNTFINDRRVYREATTLTSIGYHVTLLAVKEKNIIESETIKNIEVKRIFEKDIFDIKKTSCFNKYAKQIIANFKFDIIHAHDQTMLNLGAKLKKLKPKVVLIYDSHELFHEWPINVSNYNNKLLFLKSLIVRKLQIFREKYNKKYIDYIITVNQSLANDLQKYLKAKNNITIIRNTPEKNEKKQKTNFLHDIFHVDKNKKILVFIGGNIYRHTLNIEQVIHEIKESQDVVLIFICAFNQNSKPIIDYVKNNNFNNIFFHDLIKPSQITDFLSSADVGLVPTWNKKDKSYWYALDNKLFEYIQAGIPVLATQQPEYIGIVETHKCGICINPDNKNAYLTGFKQIIDNYRYYKINTIKTADVLCWENEKQQLINLYNKITNE